jgi:hypothetical protein
MIVRVTRPIIEPGYKLALSQLASLYGCKTRALGVVNFWMSAERERERESFAAKLLLGIRLITLNRNTNSFTTLLLVSSTNVFSVVWDWSGLRMFDN